MRLVHFAALVALCVSCSASQKAAEKVDAEKAAGDLIDCGKQEIVSALPSVTGDVLPILQDGNPDTKALEALAVSKGIDLVVCATEAVVKDALADLATPKDAQSRTIAVADCQRFWMMDHAARTFLAAHAHKPAP